MNPNSAGAAAAERIDRKRSALADAITDQHYELAPELATRYGPAGRTRCREDAEIHLKYLAEALRNDAPELFADYVSWARVMLEARNVPADDLSRNLRVLTDVVSRGAADGEIELLEEVISGASASLNAPVTPPSWIDPSQPHAELAREYLDALLAGARRRARRIILDAVESGVSVRDIYLHVFQVTQYEVGRLWQTNQITVGEEHFCTAATQWVMSELYPHIFSDQTRTGTFVAASIGDEMHEIGVRMVADFLELEGWDTHYLGARTPAASIIEAICARRADVVGLSTTITSHLGILSEIIRGIRSDNRCSQTKILVGGYPFLQSRDLWERVGADAWARDAAESVAVATELLNQNNPDGRE